MMKPKHAIQKAQKFRCHFREPGIHTKTKLGKTQEDVSAHHVTSTR